MAAQVQKMWLISFNLLTETTCVQPCAEPQLRVVQKEKKEKTEKKERKSPLKQS